MSKFKRGDKVKVPTGKKPLHASSWEGCALKCALDICPQDHAFVSSLYKGEVLLGTSLGAPSLSSFREEDLELYIPLPYKWCIQRNQENYEEVNAYFNKRSNKGFFATDKAWFWSDMGIDHDWANEKPEGYEEIDTNQFRQVIGITKPVVENKKKIFAYKAPFDLFGGEIKKGTLYPNTDEFEHDRGEAFVPIEIVRTWEPVYEEEEKTLKLGDKKIDVKIGRGYIKADGKEFSICRLEDLMKKTTFVFKGYHVTFPSISIGCTTFSLSELGEVIKIYKDLNK